MLQLIELPLGMSKARATIPKSRLMDELGTDASNTTVFLKSTYSTAASLDSLVYAVPLLNPTLPRSLLRKKQASIQLAKEYRTIHGDPIDNLAKLLNHVVIDGDVWQDILDEPYG